MSPDGVTFSTEIADYSTLQYTVISYTWGRWMRKTREADTPVVGGYWKVPANDLFSRTELDAAVRNIGGQANTWMDVLCIPQDDEDPEKAEQIRRQSSIFRSAAHAAVWLCSGGHEELRELCSAVPERRTMVDPLILDPDDPAAIRRRLAIIVDLPSLLPWTTSLWTLQETALRMDAVFHDKTGLPILHEATGNSITVRHFIRMLKTFEDQIETVEEQITQAQHAKESTHPHDKKLQKLGEFIPILNDAGRALKRTGLSVLLTTSAIELMRVSTMRVCQRPQDRVYGIMGVMGVNVPVDYTEDPSVVMANFLAALHRKVPAEMQAFHRPGGEKDTVGSLWRVDDTCDTFGLVQQLSPPEADFVAEVTKKGDLIISHLLELDDSGREELIALSLAERILTAFDAQTVAQLTGGPINCIEVAEPSPFRTCRLILNLAARARLGLVFLGSVRGAGNLAWRYMYLIVGSPLVSANSVETQPFAAFSRLGILFVRDRMRFGNLVHGRFVMQ